MFEKINTPKISLIFERMILLLVIVGITGLAAHNVHSFDVFWQLQSGKYVWQQGAFVRSDIFSLAADVPRWEHCWLHDVILYVVWKIGGYGGISLLKGLVIGVSATILIFIARHRGASVASVAFVSVPMLLLSRSGWLERPQLWTFLMLTLFLLVFEISRNERKKPTVLFVLLPLMVAWSNLHAGAVLAFPLVVAYFCGEAGEAYLPVWKGQRERVVVAAWVFGGLLLASFITPYGMTMLETLLIAPKLGAETGNIAQVYNMDWRGNSFAANPLYYYIMLVTGVTVILNWRKARLADVLLLGGLGFMGMSLSRHAPIFYLAVAGLVPAYLDGAFRLITRFLPKMLTRILSVAVLLAAISFSLYLAIPVYRTIGFYDLGIRTWHYPIEAADFIKENKLPQNIYNTYDWGGYLMWTLYPDYLVFWDGRSDSLSMFQQGLNVMSGVKGWEKILAKHQVKTIVSKACTVDKGQRYPVLDRLRDHPDWALVFSDESSLVFVRRDSVDSQWLQKYQLPASRIDDTILSEARLLTTIDPNRVMGFWEMFSIYNKRKQYREAYWALQNYLKRSGNNDQKLLKYYHFLDKQVKSGRAGLAQR